MRAQFEVSIRRATPADKRAVREICRHIWSGNDYVPDAFDDWVRDRRGGFWLAFLGDRAVGVAKLTVFGRDAWLHALRVHPRYRRRGVARALIAYRLQRAKALGAHVARLDTSNDNRAVHRLMREFGFERLGRYSFFRTRARSGEPPRRARPDELSSVVRLVQVSDGLLHEQFGRRRFTRDELERAIPSGQCIVAPTRGKVEAMAIVERYEDRIRLRHLAGAGRALGALVRALPAEAARRRKTYVGFTVPEMQWRAFKSAGYAEPWGGWMDLFREAPLVLELLTRRRERFVRGRLGLGPARSV